MLAFKTGRFSTISSYFNCSIEKLSNEIAPKIGQGEVVQPSRRMLSTTALVVGCAVKSKLTTFQSVVPLDKGAERPSSLWSPVASVTVTIGKPPLTTSCERAAKLIL